jgi:hypothetical protein
MAPNHAQTAARHHFNVGRNGHRRRLVPERGMETGVSKSWGAGRNATAALGPSEVPRSDEINVGIRAVRRIAHNPVIGVTTNEIEPIRRPLNGLCDSGAPLERGLRTGSSRANSQNRVRSTPSALIIPAPIEHPVEPQ